MIELRGVTEIVGDCGVGKTTLALSINQHVNTIYVSSALIKHSCVPQSTVLRRIGSFLELKTFVASELTVLARSYKAKKIIIDDLESYLYVFEKPRKMTGDIFRIGTVLKRLCFKEKVDVIVINNHYKNWVVDGTHIMNKYFGLPWDYLVNCRYLVTKNCETRTVKLISGVKDFQCDFVIDDMGAHLKPLPRPPQ